LSYIDSPSKVCVEAKATELANKGRLGNTIMFRDETATRTGLGSMLGVNQFYQNPSKSCFVGNKLSELGESPRLMALPLAFSNLCPLPDTLEVFKGNQAGGAFSLRHQSLANYMVGIPSKASFLPRQLFKMPFSRLCPPALKRSLEFAGLFSNLIHLLPGVKLTIAINSDMDNTEVNPQCPSGVIWCWLRGINSNGKVENTLPQDKVALPDHSIDSGFLILSNPNRDNLSTLKGQNRDIVQSLKRQNTRVKNHSRVGLKDIQFGFIPAIDFNDFTHTSHCHLSRQSIMLSQIAVSKMVKLYLSSSVMLKGKLGDIVARFVKSLHSAKKSLVLFLTRGKLNQKGLYHTISIAYSNLYVKSIKRRYVPIPPTPKGMGFLGTWL